VNAAGTIPDKEDKMRAQLNWVVGLNTFEICVMNADGTNLVQLTDNALFEGTGDVVSGRVPIRRLELALKQKVRSVASVPSGRASNDTWKYSSPALATDTYGNDSSVITPETSGHVVRYVIACVRTRPW
jgi:hypothetical protein